MDRGIRSYSGSRNNFPYEAPQAATADMSSTSGARTVAEQRRGSPQNYQRYSYLFAEDTMPATTPSDTKQKGDEEVADETEGSSTERASEGDSMKKVFDPSERHVKLSPMLVNSTPMNAELLLTDITRCQTQVEELIELFKSSNVTSTMTSAAAKPVTMTARNDQQPPLPENTPRLRQRFTSRIPRHRGEMPLTHSLDLEQARKQLTQSLEDALTLLDRFPRERQLLQRTLMPSGDAPLSHNELLEAVDCLEQISLHPSSDGDADEEEQVKEQELLDFSKRRTASRFRDVDRLPVLEETMSFSSDPCSTPSGCTGKEYWIHNAADAMLSCSMSLSHASPFDERHHHYHHHHDASTASDLWELFQTPSRNLNSSRPFRVFFQDPIQIGDLSRNSSQSLSGLETACAIRVQPYLERDAASDSEVLLTNDDILPSPRRCHSATAALCPSSSYAETNIHQRYTSLAESSDWDVVDGGISVREDRQGYDAAPGRLSPDTLPWTSTAFSTIEFRPTSRTADVLSSSLCRKSRMSHVSEVSKSHVSRELQPKVDRGVQCDFSATSSERITPWSGGCGFWFKKKNKKHRSKVLSRILLSSSGLSRLGSDEGSLATETGILCGIRTAVRAALRPPCPHSRRDRDRRSSGGVSTYLYSDPAIRTGKASRSGPSAA